MGTVGLSFGSPTSGAGFDVSTTVSQIVANLQNVETPWKTQLTSLESQDTAISSLGTLFSNLSNDIGSLTDGTGILAEKTGSSSNTSVLDLTAATSSAAAGTHTVSVNSLAATSSGYLDEIANDSDTLTGSITLQVGSGSAQTITLGSSDNTLSGLASAINSSNVGITASVLTDATGSRLSLVSGTSGADGNITVSSNSISDAGASNSLAWSGSAGSSTAASTGNLAAVASATEPVSGSISIQVGSATAVTVNVPTADATLTGLMTAINGTTGIGVTASIVTNSDGTSSLSLASQTAGSAGTLTVSSSVVDSNTALGYNSTVAGANASITVDGVNLTSASNTVTNLIPGITFQLLSTSSSPVQVVIGNDNSDVESTVNSFVTDYNSLISALNTQEGNTSSGTPEPLFGSPTLTLLQQQLLSGLNMQSPNGYLEPVSSAAGTTLSGTMTIAAGGVTKTIEIGPAPTAAEGGPAVDTIYTGSGSDSNTIAGLAAAINAANTPLAYADSGYASTASTASDTTYDTGSVGEVVSASDTLTGSLSITSGSGTAASVSMADVNAAEGGSTLADLESYINTNSATFGVTASILANSDGSSSLSLESTTANTSGALIVNPSLVDSTSSSAALTYADTGYVTASYDTGTVGAVANAGDSLSGALSITVGSGTEQSVSMSEVDSAEGGSTLADLESYINTNSATLGVSASIVTNSDGSSSLSLASGTAGTAGTLTVTSGIVDGVGASASVNTASGESTLTLLSSDLGSSDGLTVTSSLDSSTAAPLTYADSGTTSSTTADSGTLATISNSTDTLGGSITIGVANGATQTITLDSSDNTLSGLMGAINSANLGVTASLDNTGTILTLTSGTTGSSGAMNVVSNLYDSSNSTSANLNYTSSSDINSLTSLGISVNDDGSLTFDATSLDSLLNTDYNGVVGFFQNVDSWGQSFSTMLNNSGSSSSTGILALASSSNNSIESTLNADITKEDSLISAQQSSLTAELNSANEIMQQLPTQLEGVNELYSAITGYDENSGG